MNQKIEFSIPADDDGFVSFQCSFCEEKFKLNAGEFEEYEGIELFCPYCGLADEINSFLTDEVVEMLQSYAQNLAIEMFNDFGKKLKKSSRQNSALTVKVNKIKKKDEPIIREVLLNDSIVNLKCCNKKVKVLSTMDENITVCSYCGGR